MSDFSSELSGPSRGDVGDQNVERLIGQAYRPEPVDAEFVKRVEAAMCSMAREASEARAIAGLRVPVTSRRPMRWGTVAWWATAASIFIAIGFVVGHNLGRHPGDSLVTGPVTPANLENLPAGLAQPIAVTDSESAVAADRPAPAESAPRAGGLVGDRLTPRPRPQGAVADAIGASENVETQAGERRRVQLADGSVLYLNQNTRLTVDTDRQVSLGFGEIFLEVAPRPSGLDDAADATRLRAGASGGARTANTFLVHAADRDIAALGTKFAVRSNEQGAGVFVTQGKVQVSDVAETITAGQQWGLATEPAYKTQPAVSPLPRASAVLDWTRDLVAAAEAPLVPASPHAGGSIVARDPTGQETRLSLRKYHIDVHIEDGFARTTIDQTYFNHTSWRLEGTFHFPLPLDASLSRLAMYVDGKLMEGGMAERNYAREVFEKIVRTQKDPALLEWVDGSTFKMRVFPLEARQEKRIILSYTQRLDTLYGNWKYRFPSGHSLDSVRDWSLHARVKRGAEFTWSCDSHELKQSRDGTDLLLDAAANEVKLDRDLVLRFTDRNFPGDVARFSATEHDGQRYLMLRYRPELPSKAQRQRRDWIFLFESSGDRDPLLARVQVDVIKTILQNVEHDDAFAILTAGTQVRAFANELVAATPENVNRAVAFLDSVHLVGALDLDQAFTATEPFVKAGKNAFLVHVGSAMPVLGERAQDKLLAKIPSGARYVGVGVGKRWSRPFMKAAASRTGGYFTQINPDEPIAWRAFDLYSTLNTPRLLGISVVDHAERATFLCYTDSIAHGEELCAIARLTPGDPMPAKLVVSGTLDGEPFRRELAVGNIADKADYTPRTWAKLRIDQLLAEDPARHHDEIVALSKAMYVMSPFTSLLVLENEQMYAQFGVDRGRKDHWAMYACPQEIPVVHEPLPPTVTSSPTITAQSNEPRATLQESLESFIIRPSFQSMTQNPDVLHDYSYSAESVGLDGIRNFYSLAFGKDLLRAVTAPEGFAWKEIIRNESQMANQDGDGRTRFDVRFYDALGRLNVNKLNRDELVVGLQPEHEYSKFDLGLIVNQGLAARFLGQLPEVERLQAGAAENFYRFVEPLEARQHRLLVPLLREADRPQGRLAEERLGKRLGANGLAEMTERRKSWREDLNFLGAEEAELRARLHDPITMNLVEVPLSEDRRIRNKARMYGGDLSELEVRRRSETHLKKSQQFLKGYVIRPGRAGGDPADFDGARRDWAFRAATEAAPPAVQGFFWSDQNAQVKSLEDLADEAFAYTIPLGDVKEGLSYNAPRFGGSARVFSDFAAYASGMSTSRADVLALLDSTLARDTDRQMGEIDAVARSLIEKCRSASWQKITLTAPDGRSSYNLTSDGSGRFVVEMTTIDGLDEKIVCDGSTLWHLYPELGIGSKRTVTRFHHTELQSLVPWLLPPAEELARGAHLSLAADKTVAIVPLGADGTKDADGKPIEYACLHLVFARDDRLAERRLLQMPAAKVLVRETYEADGTVRLIDDDDQVLAEFKRPVEPAGEPNLLPDTTGLVMLPMPIRTREHVWASTGRPHDGQFGQWSDEDALKLLAADLLQNPAEAMQIIGQRFFTKGDRRIGFYTLLMSSGLTWDPQAEQAMNNGTHVRFDPVADHPNSTLAKYVFLHERQMTKSGTMEEMDLATGPQVAAGVTPRTAQPTEDRKVGSRSDPRFVRELAQFRDLYARWEKAKSLSNGDGQHEVNRRMALAFLQHASSPAFGWSVLTMFKDVEAAAEVHRAWAEASLRFERVPALSYAARYEAARSYGRAGDWQRARELLGALYSQTLTRGVLPPIDEDFRRVFSSGDGDGSVQIKKIFRDAADFLADRKARSSIIAVALQCHRIGETQIAEELFARGNAGLNDEDRIETAFAGVGYLMQTQQYPRADALLEPLLQDEQLARSPFLWNLGAVLAEKCGRTALSATRLDRAISIQYERLHDEVDVESVRAVFEKLLGRYQQLADSIASLETQPPREIVKRVVQAADRWRALDPDDTAACQTAARVLDSLGDSELAWEYVTTPLADKPGELPPWLKMGQTLREQGCIQLADRAYRLAFSTEPTNAQILWEQAQMLEQTGKRDAARQCYQRITEGQWDSRFEAIQQQAIQAVKSDER